MDDEGPGPADAPQPNRPLRLPHYLVLGAVAIVVIALLLL